MQKITLALCLALAVAYVQGNNGIRADDFVNMNRLQHKNQITFYDAKLQQFNNLYAGRIDDVDLHLELISNSLEQTSERLNPLELLSDHTKECVVNHRGAIPTIVEVKTKINECVAFAKSQLTAIISGAVNARDSLTEYFKNYFEKEAQNCAESTSVSEYSSCLTHVIKITNKFISENQKTFGVQLDAAICTAKANIKKALDCSFSVQENATKEIAKANVRINRCILNQTDCKPCIYECNDIRVVTVRDVSGQTIHNPFFGRTDKPECVILEVQ